MNMNHEQAKRERCYIVQVAVMNPGCAIWRDLNHDRVTFIKYAAMQAATMRAAGHESEAVKVRIAAEAVLDEMSDADLLRLMGEISESAYPLAVAWADDELVKRTYAQGMEG
jgi:hypothetical protein